MNHVTVIIVMLLLSVSCGPADQGYWTKYDVSQALTNEHFPTDSHYCERVAVHNGGRDSEKMREQLYTKCMHARGYQWMVEESRSFPAKSGGQATSAEACPTGRRIVDAFGYPKCVPVGTKSGRPNPEVRQSVTSEESSSGKNGVLPSNGPRQSEEWWRGEDRECRHQADVSLSSPYGVYAHCMQEKGLPSVNP